MLRRLCPTSPLTPVRPHRRTPVLDQGYPPSSLKKTCNHAAASLFLSQAQLIVCVDGLSLRRAMGNRPTRHPDRWPPGFMGAAFNSHARPLFYTLSGFGTHRTRPSFSLPHSLACLAFACAPQPLVALFPALPSTSSCVVLGAGPRQQTPCSSFCHLPPSLSLLSIQTRFCTWAACARPRINLPSHSRSLAVRKALPARAGTCRTEHPRPAPDPVPPSS